MASEDGSAPAEAGADERAQRAAVIGAARSWIGTPYHHAAGVKGAGCDCAMLLVRVYCDLELVEPFDPRPYTRDWMFHRGEERYLEFLLARAREVPAPSPGDVILFRYGRCFSHGGIVTVAAPLTIVHAFAPARAVVEDEIRRNAELSERLTSVKFVSYWGMTP
jgi:NlpC/P60 family putative phage cell wall peptidase